MGVAPSALGEEATMSYGSGVLKVLIREISQPLPKKGGSRLGSKMPLKIKRAADRSAPVRSPP